MITCEPRVDQGLMRIQGAAPNGNAIITREVEGQIPVLLRGGARVVTTGGIAMDDTEAPLGVPITYRVAVSGISAPERIVQQNLMPTPTFLHGVQGWLPGTAAGRTLNIVSDPTAHSAQVGLFTGTTASAAPPAAPTLVGHLDSTVFTDSNYSLQPPITGGTAIAVNDWMILVHQQLASVAVSAPIPVGVATWTLVADTTHNDMRQLIWSRKRDSNDQTGNLGYQVTVAAGAHAMGTLLWVRGATQDAIVVSPTTIVGTPRSLNYTATAAVTRPRLTLSIMGGLTATDQTPPAAGDVTGVTFQYVRSSGTNPRTLLIASEAGTDAGQTSAAFVQYGDTLTSGIAQQISLQSSATLTSRIIARGKITTIPQVAQPYVMTGRFKFVTNDLNDWQDIKNFGTWTQVRTSKVTWLGTRGSASTEASDFLSLFLTIVNPTTGADYIAPIKVFDAGEARLNTWIDFAGYFSAPAGGIPNTAEIRLVHGTKVREYAADLYLDEFGITPGAQFFSHPTLYWFDGDTPVPPDPTSYPWPGWETDSLDISITWTGTVGNSVSVFTGASGVHATTTCQLDASDTARLLPCEPILLSDPVNVTLATWLGLIHIDPLTHPSKQTVHQIINRAAPVAISQVRGWETGTITVLTMNRDQRAQILNVIRSGRVLLLRNPEPDYPENNWFLALGDVTEDRPVPNQRVTIREWTLPFVRVERPTGLIEATSGIPWQAVKDSGTWAYIRENKQDWLSVLVGTSVS